MKLVKRCLFLAIAGCLSMAAPSIPSENPQGRLVDVDWLSKNLGHPDLVLLDASPGQLYAAKHIPGAVGADFLTYGFPERPVADMERRYQSWGLSPNKKVVMYDQGGTYLATRLFFALYYHGFPEENLFVLDGGLSKWEERGFQVTQEAPPAPAKGSFRITSIREQARVRLPEFLAASGDPVNNALVEALDADWHYGELVFFGRPGHVPHGIMMPSADFFNADKTFKSPNEIRAMASHLGIRPEQQIHTYCGGGVAGSVPFFALGFLLGYPKVSLFQESLMGWLSDERQLPVWTYDAPRLMRDANWLHSWGGQRLRMFGLSTVSIVDVRSPDAFDQGHLPFAVNVPGEVFRRHLATPEQLADVLGRAGVGPSQEAVLVSGAGLTRDAALAFVMLERLRHRKVSVLMESIDGWAQQGLPVSKTATVVGPRTAQNPLAIPPVSYPVDIRRDLVVSEARTEQGTFPRIFVASGERVPATAPEGQVVHVPSGSLLNADGAPKAAKDIWKTLAKAGISRYAELVCYADDPGDAAVNYFILKLMGFPDVKIQLM